jgi:hypothetical protein
MPIFHESILQYLNSLHLYSVEQTTTRHKTKTVRKYTDNPDSPDILAKTKRVARYNRRGLQTSNSHTFEIYEQPKLQYPPEEYQPPPASPPPHVEENTISSSNEVNINDNARLGPRVDSYTDLSILPNEVILSQPISIPELIPQPPPLTERWEEIARRIQIIADRYRQRRPSPATSPSDPPTRPLSPNTLNYVANLIEQEAEA